MRYEGKKVYFKHFITKTTTQRVLEHMNEEGSYGGIQKNLYFDVKKLALRGVTVNDDHFVRYYFLPCPRRMNHFFLEMKSDSNQIGLLNMHNKEITQIIELDESNYVKSVLMARQVEKGFEIAVEFINNGKFKSIQRYKFDYNAQQE